jgi:ring-1,2-phenylacetyl-CoA epoxidase subunit PaaE
VKKVEGGLVSDLLVNHLSPGDMVELLPPMGNFTFEPDARRVRHIVLIGAGSGITPLFSILKTVLHAEPESYVSLIYGNRNLQSIIFKAELDALMQQYGGRMKLVHCLSQPPDVWYGASGRINPDLLNEIFDSIEPAKKVDDTIYYLCGPTGMMQSAEEVLKRNGVADKKILKESFFNAELNTAKEQHLAEQKDAEVTIHLDGKIYHITVPHGSTVLEAALDENIRMPYSCQSGLCTACMGKCIEGELMLDAPDGLSDEEIAAGYVLTCVGRPKTAKVVIEIL